MVLLAQYVGYTTDMHMAYACPLIMDYKPRTDGLIPQVVYNQ